MNLPRKIFKVAFGTQNNLRFKISLSSLITGIIFILPVLLGSNDSGNSFAYSFFTYASGFSFAIWLLTTHGADSGIKIVYGLIRLMMFFIISTKSIDFCLNINSYNGLKRIIFSVFAYIGISVCVFYLSCSLHDIFDFIKNLFRQVKNKLLRSDEPSTSKIMVLIKNVTLFLVSIGGLAIAIVTIMEAALQMLSLIKQLSGFSVIISLVSYHHHIV